MADIADLALILFLPWFLILGALYWYYPRTLPRTVGRRVAPHQPPAHLDLAPRERGQLALVEIAPVGPRELQRDTAVELEPPARARLLQAAQPAAQQAEAAFALLQPRDRMRPERRRGPQALAS